MYLVDPRLPGTLRYAYNQHTWNLNDIVYCLFIHIHTRTYMSYLCHDL